MQSDLPLTRDLVLVGGGHAHALVLRKWGMAPLPGARLTLVNPGPTAPYSGMLPGHVAGHYSREALDIDQLLREDWIMRERGSGTRLTLEHAARHRRGRFNILLELEHTEGIKRAVESGLGIGCVSRLALRDAFRRGSLVEL